MRKIIGAINMTLDGFCNHEWMIPDEDLHIHFIQLIENADTILYGRVTYLLMENSWLPMISNPTGTYLDQFASALDKIPKIVFSHTLKNLKWGNAKFSKENLPDEVRKLKEQSGGTILAGSRSIIISLMQMGLIDEFQICVHPVIAGSGLPLFENIGQKISLKLQKTKTLGSGAQILFYKPVR
jgi:dihydrofolate reductase